MDLYMEAIKKSLKCIITRNSTHILIYFVVKLTNSFIMLFIIVHFFITFASCCNEMIFM